MTRYGVIGIGALGQAVVIGLVEGVAEPPEVIISPRGAARAGELAATHPTVGVAADNQDVVDASDVVLVALRENHAAELAQLTWRRTQVVISTIAGVGEAALRTLVAPAERVARAVPMVAVASRSWSTPVCPPIPEAVALFERTGGAIAVHSDEEYDAIFTGLGTVAPFFEYLSVIEGFLVSHGMGDSDARVLLANAFASVGTQLGATETPNFAEMVRGHATPGGGNEQLNTLMRDAGVFSSTRQSLEEVFQRQTGDRKQ